MAEKLIDVNTVELRDQLGVIRDVAQTVANSLHDEENSQPAATTLIHHCIVPLATILEGLGERDLDDDDDDD